MNIPESLKNGRVCCPNCNANYKVAYGTLIRELDVPDIGTPEEQIEKRKYAPVLGVNNGEMVEDPAPTGFWGFIKRLFGH